MSDRSFEIYIITITGSKSFQILSNHPVHILNSHNIISPSAFIPFCSFGGNMSALGARIEMINMPVCTSFQERVFNDQLCYQIDVNKLNLAGGDKSGLGLAFAIDINEDRQVQVLRTELSGDRYDENIMDAAIMRMEEHQKALVYIGSLGEKMLIKYFLVQMFCLQLRCIFMEKGSMR